jgi:hypothetical protein
LNNDFPDDLKEFATTEYPQGALAFYQEVMPAYVGTCEEMGVAAPTAIAVILDDIGAYGVIGCIKLDGQWSAQKELGLIVRCLVSSLKGQQRKIEARCMRGIEKVIQKAIDDGRLFAADDVVQMEISPLPLSQELGIDD